MKLTIPIIFVKDVTCLPLARFQLVSCQIYFSAKFCIFWKQENWHASKTLSPPCCILVFMG